MKWFVVIIFLTLASCQKSHVDKKPVIIDKLNDQYSSIQSVSCILSSHNSITDLYYEKPNKVFLKSSFWGIEELKVSSDGQDYWFWMRNFDPKSVYHAQLEDLEFTRVIDPLKPELIKSILFIDEIPVESTVIQKDTTTQISFFKGQYYKSLIFIDGKIKEQHWFKQDMPILSIYFLNGDVIPSLVRVIWHAEEYDAKIKISQININPKEKPTYEMPAMKKINLKDY